MCGQKNIKNRNWSGWPSKDHRRPVQSYWNKKNRNLRTGRLSVFWYVNQWLALNSRINSKNRELIATRLPVIRWVFIFLQLMARNQRLITKWWAINLEERWLSVPISLNFFIWWQANFLHFFYIFCIFIGLSQIKKIRNWTATHLMFGPFIRK